MILDFSEILKKKETSVTIPAEEILEKTFRTIEPEKGRFVSDMEKTLTDAIGKIEQGTTVHYYSFGNYNLVRLIMYILKQTGPAHVFMTSYSFSQRSIEQLQKRLEKKEILTFKVIVDNRVKTMSPKPFQMLASSFDYRCISIHAKVALIWNDEWKISIITSQNATDNPKMERGVVHTDSKLFEFDKQVLDDAFQRGTI